jgi:hypothetical protein
MFEIIRNMSERNRALLGRQRKKANTPLDEFQAELLIQGEFVIGGQIMPVLRAMAHKVEAKSRTLPSHYCFDTELPQHRLEPVLQAGT